MKMGAMTDVIARDTKVKRVYLINRTTRSARRSLRRRTRC
jgi:hypothetical protein